VPNHVAPDPPGEDHPEYFVREMRGCEERSGILIEAGGKCLPRRDPSSRHGPDVLQINAFQPGSGQAVIETVGRLPGSVTASAATWPCSCQTISSNVPGGPGRRKPADDYWRTIIPAIKVKRPEFRFIAEAYWDLEWELQQQGFDFCYDKKLYDRMETRARRECASAPPGGSPYQEGMVRFIENHDEPRAAAAFPTEKGALRQLQSSLSPGPGCCTKGSSRTEGSVAGLSRPSTGRAGRSGPRGILRAPSAGDPS